MSERNKINQAGRLKNEKQAAGGWCWGWDGETEGGSQGGEILGSRGPQEERILKNEVLGRGGWGERFIGPNGGGAMGTRVFRALVLSPGA